MAFLTLTHTWRKQVYLESSTRGTDVIKDTQAPDWCPCPFFVVVQLRFQPAPVRGLH